MKSIKTFVKFLAESQTTAKKIVSLAENDYFAKNLLSKYCGNFDTSVDLLSILNLLDEDTQVEILEKIKKNRRNLKEEEPEVIANTDINLLESHQKVAGKNLFDCFLKILSGIGQKNISVNYNSTPKEFLIYLITEEVDYLNFRMVSSRFKYLDEIITLMQTSSKTIKVYYGLKNDMSIEYGFICQNSTNKIGEFKFNFDNYESLLNSELLALSNFKTALKSLNYEKLKIFGKIKKSMNDFSPGYFESQLIPTIKEDIMTFGYFGIGRWDDGFMDHNEIQSVKNNLKNYLIQFPWSQDIQLSIVAKEYWVYINIKLK